MPWPDDYVIYSLSVEDVRQVAQEEEFRELTDEELKRVADVIGDYVGWYDAVLMAIQDTVPDIRPLEDDD
jgi:hypothetical protein